MRGKLNLLFLTIVLLMPIISAYGYFDLGYLSSPSYLLENEWVMFTVIFITFFVFKSSPRPIQF